MRPGARIQAAIEVLEDLEARRRPAADALKDWGLAHRFAGSGDRAAIAGLVYDTLRYRASTAWRMDGDTPRKLVLGMLAFRRGESAESLATMFDGDGHAPALPTEAEARAFARSDLDGAPDPVRGDYPEWLGDSLARAFGDATATEMAALAGRAPLDLRVNTLKSDRDKVLKALDRFGATPTAYSPTGIRILPPEDGRRAPHVQSEAGFQKGWFEIQDEGSQLAAILTGAQPGMQAADICAGGGGKTLALAALMQGRGQVHAYDSNKRRLAPIYERVQRAAGRNIQVHAPGPDALDPLHARMDIVLVDAPCTGTGTWRRNPDAKWRLRPNALEDRKAEQVAVLDAAVPLVKEGGRLAYVTCSVLPEENDDQIAAFLSRYPNFRVTDPLDTWREMLPVEPPPGLATAQGSQLTPARTGTDGFYISILERTA